MTAPSQANSENLPVGEWASGAQAELLLQPVTFSQTIGALSPSLRTPIAKTEGVKGDFPCHGQHH